ncbi:hypothetical protein Shyhy02_08670 [Streptomyces hygroscopicus subsp. hygroscopicus]|nr:hypothetical protein Shyhy02_08670 [Streptomyces hygroscopicus subsp. hygroscopicus]
MVTFLWTESADGVRGCVGRVIGKLRNARFRRLADSPRGEPRGYIPTRAQASTDPGTSRNPVAMPREPIRLGPRALSQAQ